MIMHRTFIQGPHFWDESHYPRRKPRAPGKYDGSFPAYLGIFDGPAQEIAQVCRCALLVFVVLFGLLLLLVLCLAPAPVFLFHAPAAIVCAGAELPSASMPMCIETCTNAACVTRYNAIYLSMICVNSLMVCKFTPPQDPGRRITGEASSNTYTAVAAYLRWVRLLRLTPVFSMCFQARMGAAAPLF